MEKNDLKQAQGHEVFSELNLAVKQRMMDQSIKSKIENNRLCYIQYHLSDFAILQVYK